MSEDFRASLAYNEEVTIPKGLENVLVSTPDTLSGGVRFKGTRVFVQSLFDYVMGGDSIEEFLEDFPGVTREQVNAVLRYEQSALSGIAGGI